MLVCAGEAAVILSFHRLMLWLGLPHWYLSTGCLHGGPGHAYCSGLTGTLGRKSPARCKFCQARCRCRCHRSRA